MDDDSLNDSLGEDFADDFAFDLEADDKRDDAARVIQRLSRTFLARIRLRNLVRANYIKKYDRVNERHYYKNKSTGEILNEKPRVLGSDDLPDPRSFVAPENYEVGGEDENMPTGYALVLCNTEFPRSDGRLPPLPHIVDNEFAELEDILSHDFICRFPQENVYCLKNAKKAELKDTIERLRQVVRKKDFFLFYICTHVLTIVNGEKSNASETCYFAMPNSLWSGKPEVVAPSCMSLTDLVKMISKVKSRKKTVLVNYAYREAPKKAFFAPVKSVYPPANFLARLADKANCAVIACCVTGNSMSDTISHHTHKIPSSKNQAGVGASLMGLGLASLSSKPKAATSGAQEGEESKVADGGADGEGERDGGDKEKDDAHEDDEDDDEHHSDEDEEGRDFENEDFQTALGGGYNHHQTTKKKIKKVSPKTPTQQLVEEYLSYWKVPPDPEIVLSSRPPRPMPTWGKDEENPAEFVVELPTLDDSSDHFYQLIWWRLKRIARPVGNFFKRQYRRVQRRIISAPCQSNLIIPDEEHGVFTAAVFSAFRGGAHKDSKKIVTAKYLYEALKEGVAKRLEKWREELVLEREKAIDEKKKEAAEAGEDYVHDAAGDEALKEALAKVVLSPAFYVPKNNLKASRNPVCLRCGPPAAPEKPFVMRQGTNEISLEWYNQDFDGVPAQKYEIEVKNRTRVYKIWRKVVPPADITKTAFTVRDLPSGVPTQFRVRAYNNGGWSKFSLPTRMVTPGEHLTPLPTTSRWMRITQGGPFAAIDIMNAHPLDRNEHVRGMKLLYAFAVQNNGFLKGTLQLKAAHSACHCLINFHHDIELARLAFLTLLYCTKEDTPGFKKVRIYLRKVDIFSLATEYQEFFRLDGGIVNFIQWLRSNPGYDSIPPPPVVVIPEDMGEAAEEDDEELERLAVEEDKRLEEERIEREREEREFNERARLAKEKERMAKIADEALKKANEKTNRDKAEAAARNAKK